MKYQQTEWFSIPRIMCGLMSGTSLDGIDAAIVEFADRDGKHSFILKSQLTVPYSNEIRDEITRLIEKKSTIAEVSWLHTALSELHASATQKACEIAGISTDSLDGIGFHGQTVWHAPRAKKKFGLNFGSTLQLGSPSVLANVLDAPVVGDFRSADVAVGGQGAPLVPIFDSTFLREEHHNVIALNIGGIANITLLPPIGSKDEIRAFDTGPGNVLIDAAARMFFGKQFDSKGSIAEAGRTIKAMLEQLKQHTFITKTPPKSTGREEFNSTWLEKRIRTTFQPSIPTEDILRTITEFTAWSIAENIRLFASPTSKIIASGGGIHNRTLMSLLQNELPIAQITTADAIGIPSDAKEAVCFAYLAYRTLGGLTGNIPSVTGAKRPVKLGVVAFP
ncbi:MAG: anhydro-N-acetylmuramic acid kinase [Ignavibacteriae bacterium]|nr:anhydro-N-acetylmuramic acid kinase [Ignavibacteriota bacterium]